MSFLFLMNILIFNFIWLRALQDFVQERPHCFSSFEDRIKRKDMAVYLVTFVTTHVLYERPLLSLDTTTDDE